LASTQADPHDDSLTPTGRSAAENPTLGGKASALPQDFETALAQLESLVAAMEDGSLPLEESLAAYRRGVELTRICQERLAQAEQQVRVLEGDLLRPLDPGTLDDESNG
jgi:exodeoxyribonuclease VII small subunit